MDAGAAGGGVDDEAGGGFGVIGDAGALVGGEVGVGVVGGDYGEAGGTEERAETGGEGQGEIFFHGVVGEVGSGVGASVGGVEEDDGADGFGRLWDGEGLLQWRCGGWLCGLRGGLSLGLGRDCAQGEEAECRGLRDLFMGTGHCLRFDCNGVRGVGKSEGRSTRVAALPS